MTPLGVILAGGRATRMGGGDKGLRLVGGRRLVDHVIGRLRRRCAGLALNANGDPARLAEFGCRSCPTAFEGHAGPLAGVLAGLDWAAGQGAEAIVTAAADTPFFPPTWWRACRRRRTFGPLRWRPAGRTAVRRTRPSASGPWRCARTCARRCAGAAQDRALDRPARRGLAPVRQHSVRSVLQRQHARGYRRAEGWRGGMKVYGVTGWKNTGKTG
jgi:CTP:molybdopterin cytidylyltransferase MocA